MKIQVKFKVAGMLKFMILLFLFVYRNPESGYSQSMNFSQVILITKGTTDTVPANKVWKIESYTAEGEIVGSSSPMTVQINGTTNYLAFNAKDGNGAIYEAGGSRGPLWLPAGTILAVNSANCGIELVSIIEFTVGP